MRLGHFRLRYHFICTFWIPDSIPKWIPDSKPLWIPDSSLWIPDSNSKNLLDSVFSYMGRPWDTRRRSENLIAISPRVTKSRQHSMYSLCQGVLHSLSLYILFDTSKASENLSFILKQSLILSGFYTCVNIIICCLAAMKIEVWNDPDVFRDHNHIRIHYCEFSL